MTENHTKEMFSLLTKCVSGIQELKEDVAVLKSDVSVLKSDMSEVKQDVAVLKLDMSEVKQDIAELKEGQKRIEKEVRLNTAAVNKIAGEQVRLYARVDELEAASV